MVTQISNEQETAVDEGALVQLAEYVLLAEGAQENAGNVELSIALVDEGAMLDLNRDYRGKDYATDVLSFEAGTGMPAGPDTPRLLGDVVICPVIAEKQAREFGATFDEEMALLLVHGILHLLGYDHELDDEAERMEARERFILSSFREGVAPEKIAKGGLER